ncbi:MAG: GHMP family kinase ATP-binding protein [Candidatus Thorarchaeota archaeon]
MEESFRVRAPGRICLFGEHSDYLGLDVIAASINMAIEILCTPREDRDVNIVYTDLKENDSFSLDSEIQYRNKRDYVRSAFNVMIRKGNIPVNGVDLKISGNIPIAAGLSSSSALTVGAVMVVSQLSEAKMNPEEIALTAYEAEVEEFGESGGNMDHFASAVGGVIHVDMKDNSVSKLPTKLDSIVIGDSEEKKQDTVGDLRYIRTTVEREYELITQKISSFDRRSTPVNRVYELSKSQPTKERSMAEATLRNRDLTSRALRLLDNEKPNHQELGEMLKEHHEILRDDLDRSTPKIEQMIDAAYSAGAIGCKINGSGGGGTMMAYVVGKVDDVASAIEKAGGTAYIVKVGNRATLTILDE